MTEEPNDKYRDLLVTVLGLKPADGATEVSDEQITAAVDTAGETIALAAKTPPTTEAPKVPATEASADVVALNARLDDIEKNNLLTRAAQEGKVVPLSAEDIKTTSVAILTSMIDKLPAGEVPTQSKIKGEQPDNTVALSADEQAIAKQLGLTDEEYRAAQ